MSLATLAIYASIISSIATVVGLFFAGFAFWYQVRQAITERWKARHEFEKARDRRR